MRASRAVIVFLAFLIAGCASSSSVRRPFPGAPAPPRKPGTSSGTSLVRTAMDLKGAPYRNGGSDPRGFDCSGFVYYVFERHGYRLPRMVGELYRTGRRVNRKGVSAGDLVFFKTVTRGPSHVGIAVSRNEFIHAPSSRGVVRIERLGSEYWSRRFLGARRLAR